MWITVFLSVWAELWDPEPVSSWQTDPGVACLMEANTDVIQWIKTLKLPTPESAATPCSFHTVSDEICAQTYDRPSYFSSVSDDMMANRGTFWGFAQ